MRLKLLLPALLCLLLAACATNTARLRIRPEVTEIREGSEMPLSFEVHLEHRSGNARAEDGTVLASWVYQIPVMSALRLDGAVIGPSGARTERERQALSAADTFNAEFERWAEDADFSELEALARGDYQWRKNSGFGWDTGYAQELTCSLYQTERLVSVSGRFYYYGGGAHPNTVLLGWNFDPETGAFISVDRLFDDTAPVADTLVGLAEARARQYNLPADRFFWEDFDTILASWYDAPASVTFDAESMTVAYSPYDLACFAAGEQCFTIPRDQLTPWLSLYGKTLLSVSES